MLKLEYLHEGSTDCPLIRLYDYEPSDVVALRESCLALADGRLREVSLDRQAWVNAIGGCCFVFRSARTNRGVRDRKGDEPFVMECADEGWREVVDRLSPFVDGSGGFQWLTNEGDVNVLISRDGLW